MKNKHTPAPWTQNGKFIGTSDSNDDILNGCHPDVEQAIANAAHIVHCVNSHDKLIAALQLALKYIGDPRSNRESNTAGCRLLIKEIKAVLEESTHGQMY